MARDLSATNAASTYSGVDSLRSATIHRMPTELTARTLNCCEELYLRTENLSFEKPGSCRRTPSISYTCLGTVQLVGRKRCPAVKGRRLATTN